MALIGCCETTQENTAYLKLVYSIRTDHTRMAFLLYEFVRGPPYEYYRRIPYHNDGKRQSHLDTR